MQLEKADLRCLFAVRTDWRWQEKKGRAMRTQVVGTEPSLVLTALAFQRCRHLDLTCQGLKEEAEEARCHPRGNVPALELMLC